VSVCGVCHKVLGNLDGRDVLVAPALLTTCRQCQRSQEWSGEKVKKKEQLFCGWQGAKSTTPRETRGAALSFIYLFCARWKDTTTGRVCVSVCVRAIRPEGNFLIDFIFPFPSLPLALTEPVPRFQPSGNVGSDFFPFSIPSALLESENIKKRQKANGVVTCHYTGSFSSCVCVWAVALYAVHIRQPGAARQINRLWKSPEEREGKGISRALCVCTCQCAVMINVLQ
jgi:hypothetical protein